ncbi:YsnF/AvaK domain-containing protein [Hymenobacter sp. BT491]|uniref:YsnF/AvaK domain-containing protein n=1 Tax=Hymenobacter sp. BT491 TaxID=2766779 RepID=UPI001653A83F|nr:YsnF/AvaK domain-containing protein [Hymenobacter sp. BT491]MBC6991047.1 YsnF/AvaK domain-containing protein [Hymenobacter sp. BT491]
MNYPPDPNQPLAAPQPPLEPQPLTPLGTIPVIEEQARVGKQVVESGTVHISKSVSSQDQTLNIPLVHEEVKVERVVINQYVDTAPAVRYEGTTMVIPILREEVVVQKRLVLVEELHVTKLQVQTTQTEQVTLRKEEVTVNRATNPNPTPPIL